MAKLTYVTPDGDTIVVENAAGNLMTVAVDNGYHHKKLDQGKS